MLHSLFFPAFRVKADAIPGRYSSVWFTPTKVGEYWIFCAEYCGTRHSGMVGHVTVMEARDYQAWLSGTTEGPLSARGERLFSDLACNTCHRSDGTGRGPALEAKFGTEEQLATGAVVRVDASYVRESILNPQLKIVAGYQPLMPTFQGLVNEDSVMALVEYVKSLQASPRPAATAGEAHAADVPAQENR